MTDEYAARLTAAITTLARDEADAIDRVAAVIAEQLPPDGYRPRIPRL